MLGKGVLEKKIKFLQHMLSHEAAVEKPMKLQEVRDGKLRKHLTDRVQKWSVMGLSSTICL